MAEELPLRLDATNLSQFVSDGELAGLQPEVERIHSTLENRQGHAAEWGGWLHLPSEIAPADLDPVKDFADEVRERAQLFVSIGIGGSYLGARAAVEFASASCVPEVMFCGNDLCADRLANLEHVVGDRSLYVNVVSRSGGTVEPAVAFRFFRELLSHRYGDEAGERIAVTTVAGSPLWRLAQKNRYRRFAVPQDVGGRYSAFTPVVLLPAAVADIDLDAYVEGGAQAERATGGASITENEAYRLAASRKLLYDQDKVIEVMACFDPSTTMLGHWWRQLAGESEGKEEGGIFPSVVEYTADLHSMGQWMQEGSRNVFETFLVLERPNREAPLPDMEDAGDGYDYLAGKQVSFINRSAYEATAKAHLAGGVPNATVSLAARTPQALGAFFYFFMRTVAMTGMLFGVNPFDQPGVEAYKQEMYRLLGRPEHD